MWSDCTAHQYKTFALLLLLGSSLISFERSWPLLFVDIFNEGRGYAVSSRMDL